MPINQGAFVNDGKRILKLLRPGAYADGYAAVMAVGAYTVAQVRPRDRDPHLVAQAASLADGSHEDLAGRFAAHADALHRGDVEVAGEHIRYLLDHRAGAYPPYRPVIDLAAAYFEAMSEKPGPEGRSSASFARGTPRAATPWRRFGARHSSSPTMRAWHSR